MVAGSKGLGGSRGTGTATRELEGLESVSIWENCILRVRFCSAGELAGYGWSSGPAGRAVGWAGGEGKGGKGRNGAGA